MSAHVGDLDSVLSVDVFRRAIDDLLEFFQATPDAVVCDLHPDYASTRHAEQLAARWDVPLLRVQHHHAHVAACMAEHGLQGPVLGFSWDGTGYGPTERSGAARRCCAKARSSAGRRTSAPSPCPAAIAPCASRGARPSGCLFEILGPSMRRNMPPLVQRRTSSTRCCRCWRGGVNSPRTSSMGRLFDAVAAICGLPPVISFEGQAAMALEFAADEHEQERLHRCHCRCRRSRLRKPCCPRCSRRRLGAAGPVGAGRPRRRRAGRTHQCPLSQRLGRHGGGHRPMRVAADTTQLPIVLTGGCFQNALLTARVRSRLSAAGFSGVYSSSGPAGRRRHCPRASLRRPATTARIVRCVWESPVNWWKSHQQDDLPMGKVEFGGILKDVCLAYTPEAQVGDYVLVHVGFAISRIDEAEAQEIFGYLEEIGSTMDENEREHE